VFYGITSGTAVDDCAFHALIHIWWLITSCLFVFRLLAL
jgi:hypothetical protein